MRLHSFLLTGVFLAAFCPAEGQGLLNNGAYIVMSGAAQIYVANASGNYLSQSNGRITPGAGSVITVNGNWTNNAGNTGFTADAGTVVLAGAAQSINGTASTTFYNLTLQGSGTKTLNVATNVGGVVTTTGVLSIGSRPLSLNSNRLTITNTSSAAVTYTTGYVLSETNAALNPSIMQWNTGAFSATYFFPFGTAAGTQIPLTFNKTVATASNVSIATRPTAASNNLPWASGVTHMYDPTLAQDGSDEAVIDRWWEITASTAITADINFRYLGSENTLIVPYNTGNLGAQYWSSAWLPNNSNIGSNPAVMAGVGMVLAPGLSIANTYTPWVLSSLSAPLPIELTAFEAACDNGNAVLHWNTATETNNNFFTIERCDDGVNFHPEGTVAGAGTSTQPHSYSFTDPTPVAQTTYYRLRQTDYNGQSQAFSIRTVESCSAGDVVNAWASEGNFDVHFELANAGHYTIRITDARGRIVASYETEAGAGATQFTYPGDGFSEGVYFVNVSGEGKIFSRKVVVTR